MFAEFQCGHISSVAPERSSCKRVNVPTICCKSAHKQGHTEAASTSLKNMWEASVYFPLTLHYMLFLIYVTAEKSMNRVEFSKTRAKPTLLKNLGHGCMWETRTSPSAYWSGSLFNTVTLRIAVYHDIRTVEKKKYEPRWIPMYTSKTNFPYEALDVGVRTINRTINTHVTLKILKKWNFVQQSYTPDSNAWRYRTYRKEKDSFKSMNRVELS
jgi:hypothetical protein